MVGAHGVAVEHEEPALFAARDGFVRMGPGMVGLLLRI
jgi:hypothetical protein